jgi:hypothetical protein
MEEAFSYSGRGAEIFHHPERFGIEVINRLIIVLTLSFRRKPESSGFLDAGSSSA